MRQAVPVERSELDNHQITQRFRRLIGTLDRRIAREGLIYTSAGVLDMTRRRVAGPDEEIVGWIGGARAW